MVIEKIRNIFAPRKRFPVLNILSPPGGRWKFRERTPWLNPDNFGIPLANLTKFKTLIGDGIDHKSRTFHKNRARDTPLRAFIFSNFVKFTVVTVLDSLNGC